MIGRSPGERAAALLSGKKRWFTGKPCRKGHIAERRLPSWICVECSRISDRKKNGQWAKKYPEKHAAQGKRWNEANPERRKQIAKKHRAANQGAFSATEAKRQANIKNATPQWADFTIITAVYKLRDKISAETGVKHEVDHIVPIGGKTVCGLHVHYNLRIIPASENRSKNANLIPELLLAA